MEFICVGVMVSLQNLRRLWVFEEHVAEASVCT
jgi:hypothetical protein